MCKHFESAVPFLPDYVWRYWGFGWGGGISQGIIQDPPFPVTASNPWAVGATSGGANVINAVWAEGNRAVITNPAGDSSYQVMASSLLVPGVDEVNPLRPVEFWIEQEVEVSAAQAGAWGWWGWGGQATITLRAQTLNMIGFRFEPSVSGANWQARARVGAVIPDLDTGVPVVGLNRFGFKLVNGPTVRSAALYLNGAQVLRVTGAAVTGQPRAVASGTAFTSVLGTAPATVLSMTRLYAHVRYVSQLQV